jgi:hypothetical protein
MERILAFSVRRRWLVLLLTIAAAISGAWSLTKLPIDAVPDVTNVQVQINAMAPALSPIEIEKQVTFPIETALAGTPGLESTRSFSRNGFAQVTAIFTDKTDIYFARQQVAERLTEAKSNLPPGVEVKMGPISTGLGEIYWWSVEYAPPGEGVPVRDGKPGWQSDGSYLTPDGERLTDDFRRTVYLRTIQDWIIRPQMKSVPGVAGADAIGGYVKQYQVQPDPARLIAYGLSFGQIVKAIEANNVSRGANYIERNGEGYVVRTSGRVETLAEIEDIVVATRGAVPVRIKDVAEVRLGRELRTGSASVNGREVVLGTALMLIGGNSRTVAAAADAKIKEINRTLPPSIRAQTVLNRTELVEATIRTVATNLAEGALLVILVLFLLLGNFRAALITAMVIPVTMLITATGMLEAKLSANLMSLGALDFGLIVDGAVIIVENSLRHLAERQRELGRTLSLDEHLDTVTTSASLWPSHYHARLRPASHFHWCRRQDVHADGNDRDHRARDCVRAIAHLCTGNDRDRGNRACAGKGESIRPRPEGALSARIGRNHSFSPAGDRQRGASVRGRCGVVHAPWSGVHSDAGREKYRHGGQADSEHIALAIAIHAAGQRGHGQPVAAGRVCLFAHGHPRLGGGSHAPECVRHLHHSQATRPLARSGPVERGFDRPTGQRSIEIAGQQNRLLTADSDALQRADRRGARGFGGQGLR